MSTKLGNICIFQSGGTPSKGNPDYFGGDIPWITTTALNGSTIDEQNAVDWITEKAIAESAAKVVPANSIMVGTRVGVGKAAVNAVPMSTSQDIISLIGIDESRWSKDYLCKFIQSKSAFLNSQARGATIKGIKIDILSALNVPEISFDAQKKVAGVIDRVNAVRSKQERELQLLDNLIKARFVELFGDPIKNTKSLKVKRLEELGTWNSGGTPSRTKPEYFTGDINWYSAGELNSLYLHGSIEKITAAAIEESAAKLFRAGSMLVGMYDTAAFKMGILKEDSASNQACACIEPNESVNIVWLYYALSLMKENYLSQRRGVRQKNLNLGMIRGFELPVAEKIDQDEFVKFVEQVDKSKVAVQKALDETKRLFDSLMQQYFG